MAEKFMKSLRALARVTNRDLAPEVFELFEALVLSEHGEENAMYALTEYVRGNSRGFPMPGELLTILKGPQLSTKQIASETADRMLGMIPRRGYTWCDTYKYDGYECFEDAIVAEIGEEAIPIINRNGGWAMFCQQFDEGVNGNARAQLRDLVEVQLIRKDQNAARARLEPPRTKPLDEVGEYIAKQKLLRAKRETAEAVAQTKIDLDKTPF